MRIAFLVLTSFLSASSALAAGSVGEGVPGFRVRDGYRVTLAAEGFGNARFIEFAPDGTMFVSQPGRRNILALKDKDGDGVFETRVPFVEDQSNVHSMDFHDGWLYYTASNEGWLRRARDTDGDGRADEIVEVFPANTLPTGGGHPFRGVLVADDRIYITVSDPGNISDDFPSENKTIYLFDKDGSNKRVFATGIRNTEKLQFRVRADGTQTDEVWGADHGSDWIGRDWGDRRGVQPITDLLPPCELNHYVQDGFYGHPFFVGPRIPRPEFLNRQDSHELAQKTIPPAWNYGAHWAPNGFTFVAGDKFPGLRGDLLQAFHGSWNSSVRVGYCVSRVFFDPMTGKPYGEWKIVDCFDEAQQRVLGRPVDVAEAPDGTIYFSCDMTNKVYRITPE